MVPVRDPPGQSYDLGARDSIRIPAVDTGPER